MDEAAGVCVSSDNLYFEGNKRRGGPMESVVAGRFEGQGVGK